VTSHVQGWLAPASSFCAHVVNDWQRPEQISASPASPEVAAFVPASPPPLPLPPLLPPLEDEEPLPPLDVPPLPEPLLPEPLLPELEPLSSPGSVPESPLLGVPFEPELDEQADTRKTAAGQASEAMKARESADRRENIKAPSRATSGTSEVAATGPAPLQCAYHGRKFPRRCAPIAAKHAEIRALSLDVAAQD
jgi:hypothetical protein